ncbi:hypothetical protein [Pontibacter anaerobius]|uniref:Uncharacterized protein n=1 Tax=Pontibacter anaerobius TaxID=2993940 RepID=A0ABT3RIH3_9BACT|nr:hypothetical protein [Pontibacter anaerobius]MCX2741668.1 hypothetical protein [Pontibacter anaerobius]
MRNLLLASILFCVLTSCSKDTTLDEMQTELAANQYPQKWQLVSMSGNIANVPPQTGDDMAWQEAYMLNSDNTFIKTREQNGTRIEASGTFVIATQPDAKTIIMTYTSPSGIIGACSGDQKEYLGFKDEFLIGSWQACDGPGLKYKRVNFAAYAN